MDRALLGPAAAEAGPATAAAPETGAAAAGAPAQGTSAAAPPSNAAPAPSAAAPSLAERLRGAQATIGAWDHSSLREAFRPSGEWLDTLKPPAPAEAVPAPAGDLRSKVRLTSIVSGSGGSFVRAVIDSKTWVIPVGGEVQGLRLVSVDEDERAALFELGGEELLLRLEAPRLGGHGAAPAPAEPSENDGSGPP